MSDWRLEEGQLLELNSFLQRSDDVLVHNCLTRTAQESKLFPVLPYLMMSFYEAYWRYPDQLRRASKVISPEDAGHRARNVSCLLSKMTAWGIVNYYLNGRSLLIRAGLIRPQDNLEDLWTVVDWYRRFSHAYHRASGQVSTLEAWDMAQDHEERTLQVFEADCFEVDSDLRAAAGRFKAVATQFNFLVHCESRSGLQASGPYRLGGRRLMHVRDFFNLSESTLPWMDGIGEQIPFANLSLVEITDGVAVEITDWATPYTVPESYQDRVIGVGLFTSDFLSDRYEPVGMGSRSELIATFDLLTERMTAATRELYRRFSGYTMDQMIEAGIITYYQAPIDLMRMAGLYEPAEWGTIELRTRRLWQINNEEYALDSYVDHFNLAGGRLGAQSEYYLHPVSYAVWRRGGHADELPATGRTREFVPASALRDDDYPRRVNPRGLDDLSGDSKLAPKSGRLRTTAGLLSPAEINATAREWRSPLLSEPWRSIDEATVKWGAGTENVDALYRYVQERSRLLKERGSSLLREDIARLRESAGEAAWEDLERDSHGFD